MGRKKDYKIWQEFDQMGGVSKCKHCGAEFRGKPSASRLRKHLIGVKDGGFCICTKVPDQIKAALLDDSSKRRRIDPSSINNGVGNSTATSSSLQNNNHLELVVHGEQRMQEAVQYVEEETGQYQMFQSLIEQGDDELDDLKYTM